MTMTPDARDRLVRCVIATVMVLLFVAIAGMLALGVAFWRS